MRDYAKVLPTFWTGPTGRMLRELGAEAQVMAMYLITSPHSTMTGLYRLPVAYASHDTGLTIQGASKALQRLSEVGFAFYEEASEEVWVPEMARIQIGERLLARDNRHKALLKELDRYRKSRFFPHFVEKYREDFALPYGPEEAENARPLEAPSKPLRSQEQEQEQEQKDLPSTPPEPPPAGPSPQEQIRDLAARYPAELVAEAREAVALSRRTGKVSDSVWLRTLKKLNAYPLEAAVHAMRVFSEKHADGDKGEAYLVAIAKREATAPKRDGVQQSIPRPSEPTALQRLEAAQFQARLDRDFGKVRELQTEIDAILDANRARAAGGAA